LTRPTGIPWHWPRSLPLPLRLGWFLGLLLLVTLPFGILVRVVTGSFALAWVPLYGVLLWGMGRWAAETRQQRDPWGYYGLTGSRLFWQELGLAFGLGLGGLFLLFGLEGILGWLSWQSVASLDIWVGLLNGLLVGPAVALVEELLFRGWLLQEWQIEWGMTSAGWGTAVLFAVAHFLKPLEVIIQTWPQFLGLLLMGWLLAYGRQVGQGRLGLALGLHASWIAGITWVNHADWIRYTDRVPPWITGIDGNPLAGVMGILFLGLTAGVVRAWGHSRLRP